VPSRPPSRAPGRGGLSALRRSGAISDLLFLYECATRDVGQLRTIAEALGISVQAASHTFRALRLRGLAELRDGRYRPSVRGVAWLHTALGGVRDDLAERLDRLHIVRTTRAVAATPIRAGEPVALELRDGTLVARAGPGTGSRGRARTPASAGELVEVGELEGIVPLPHGRLSVVLVPGARAAEGGLVVRLRSLLASARPGLLLAFGLEASHLVGRTGTKRPVLRFGVPAAIVEATRLGVDCTLVVVERDLPRLFEQFEGPDVPPIELLAVGGSRRDRTRD
jgi:putative transcriptional regulator